MGEGGEGGGGGEGKEGDKERKERRECLNDISKSARGIDKGTTNRAIASTSTQLFFPYKDPGTPNISITPVPGVSRLRLSHPQRLATCNKIKDARPPISLHSPEPNVTPGFLYATLTRRNTVVPHPSRKRQQKVLDTRLTILENKTTHQPHQMLLPKQGGSEGEEGR